VTTPNTNMLAPATLPVAVTAAPSLVPAAGAGILSSNGARLVSNNGASLIADAGGGVVQPPGLELGAPGVGVGANGGTKGCGGPCQGAIAGRVELLADLPAGGSAALPVAGAVVVVLPVRDSEAKDMGLRTDLDGTFALPKAEIGLLAARSRMKLGGNDLQLCALVEVHPDQTATVLLDGASTLLEASFYVRYAGSSPGRGIDTAFLAAHGAALRTFAAEIPLASLATSATPAERHAAYEAIVAAHPAAFAGLPSWPARVGATGGTGLVPTKGTPASAKP